MRVIGWITRQDLENEARNITNLIKIGVHNNIIAIMAHGPIKDYYFIDMELCDLTLNAYIHYLAGSGSLGIEIQSSISPVLVEKDCSAIARMDNVLTIGCHIARGLAFLHDHGQVHRDLKPLNGIARQS